MRKIIYKSIFVLFALCVAFTVFCPKQAYATSKNTAAHNAYSQKLTSLSNDSEIDFITYYYKDLNSDGVDEAIVMYYEKHGSSGALFKIYTYTSGKLKTVCSTANYNFSKLTYYKKSKSFVVYSYGHGIEVYDYYKYSNGKYKSVASKYRDSLKAGGNRNGSWCYYKGCMFLNSSRSTKAASFNKLIKGIKKGKSSTISYSKFKSIN